MGVRPEEETEEDTCAARRSKKGSTWVWEALHTCNSVPEEEAGPQHKEKSTCKTKKGRIQVNTSAKSGLDSARATTYRIGGDGRLFVVRDILPVRGVLSPPLPVLGTICKLRHPFSH